MVQENGSSDHNKPEPGKDKPEKVDRIVEELRNVLSGMRDVEAMPPAPASDPQPLNDSDPAPMGAPEDFTRPANDSDLWRSNVLGWPENDAADDNELVPE